MAGFTERKVHMLGCWTDNQVSGDTIARIDADIKSNTGDKVKLMLYRDGLRIWKHRTVLGKTLQEFIPIGLIHFLTVSQHSPAILFVIAKARDNNFKYQIQAFKCANAHDASLYLTNFKSFHRTIEPGHGLNAQLKEHDGLNWTLRGKEKEADAKRELKQLVDYHDERAIISANGGVKQTHVEVGKQTHVEVGKQTHVEVVEKRTVSNTGIQNGYVDENEVTRIPLYRKGKPTRIPNEYVHYVQNGDISDAHSETSEAGLRVELDTLTQEVRDIKSLLENNIGIAHTVSAPAIRVSSDSSPREFQQVNVAVHKHAVAQKEVQYNSDPVELQAFDAIVLDDEQQNGTRYATDYSTTTTHGNVAHVRVSVPDYRTPTERTVTHTSTRYEQPEHKIATTSVPDYRTNAERTVNYTTTRYEQPEHKIATTSVPDYRTNAERTVNYTTTSYEQPEHTIATTSVPDYRTNAERTVNYTTTRYEQPEHKIATTSVPDYRTNAERTVSYSTTTYEQPEHKIATTSSGFGTVSSTASATSYDNWKRHQTTKSSQHGQYNEMAGRIQWKSRTHTTPRPRTVSGSSYDSVDYSRVSMRHPSYTSGHYVTSNHRTARLEDRQTQSLRIKGFPTSVVKPIEKVYEGRHAAHSSLVYRPTSQTRPTILLDNEGNYVTPELLIEPNNNITKLDDKHLLDVSGIDLYRDTPINQISNAAVIRT